MYRKPPRRRILIPTRCICRWAEDRKPKPGDILINDNTPQWTRKELMRMGYRLTYGARTSGPINAIYFDWKHGSFWGGSSNHGDDYGIGW
jgi:gamma-glutamyltranspeptidase/glutathione hydrolase